ncbi:hypothetical protein SAZ11_56385 [Streptomyces sp. FXJ1.4098]|nr:hypothetical protein [Streptomyces sp. FXJ1.4098]
MAAAAGTGTSVVQEYVAPRGCRLAMVADGAEEPHDVEVAPVFGPLLFGGRRRACSPGSSAMARRDRQCPGHQQLRRLRGAV